MSEYYTVKQVEGLLKLNRITIYRMIQDGRLNGIKIGSQWRFSQAEIERIFGEKDNSLPDQPEIQPGLPTQCFQTIQNLLTDISQLSSLVVDMRGNQITAISAPCSFCRAMISSQAGREACQVSWREIASRCSASHAVDTCHAGLNYAASPVYDHGEQIGAIITGQYYIQTPDRHEESERVKKLASRYKIRADVLQKEILNVPILKAEQSIMVKSWMRSAAIAVQGILEERAEFMTRLQKIANLTQIE
jgi:excisionase family DNA binding protein